MNIKFCGKPVTPAQLRRIGFMAVNLATNIERYDVQLKQAQANPDDAQERIEADRAASRVIEAYRKLRDVGG